MIRQFWLASGSLALAVALAASAEAQIVPGVWLDVDCGAGQTIGDALLKSIDEPAVFLNVSGTCRESVTITRDDVGLVGQPGATIDAGTTGEVALAVRGGRRIWASGLTLRGGYSAALLVFRGDFSGERLTILEGNRGVATQSGAEVYLSNTSIEGSRYEGVFALNAEANLANCTLLKNRSYGIWAQNSHVSLYNADIAGSRTGLAGDAISAILTAGQYVRIHDNEMGVRLKLNSVGWHNGAVPTVSNNTINFSIDASSIW